MSDPLNYTNVLEDLAKENKDQRMQIDNLRRELSAEQARRERDRKPSLTEKHKEAIILGISWFGVLFLLCSVVPLSCFICGYWKHKIIIEGNTPWKLIEESPGNLIDLQNQPYKKD